MSRKVRKERTRNPLATALAIDFLHGYAEGETPVTDTERSVYSALARMDPDRLVSRGLVRNFASISISEKVSTFGEFIPGRLRQASREDVSRTFSSLILPTAFRDDVSQPEVPNYPDQTNFTITYTGLYCRTGTGDRGIFGPSDEPYVITVAVHVDENGHNVERVEKHPAGDPDERYGNVDSGNWRRGPYAACWSGTAKEVSIVTVVMEHDEGDPDAYKKEIQVIVSLAVAIALANGVPIHDSLKILLASFLTWLIGSGDDEVGTEIVILDPSWLKLGAAADKPTYSASRQIRVPIGFMGFREETVIDETDIPYSFTSHHDDEGEYVVCYRITADRDPVNRPIVSEVAITDIGRVGIATRRN